MHWDCRKRHGFCEEKEPQKPRLLRQPVMRALGLLVMIAKIILILLTTTLVVQASEIRIPMGWIKPPILEFEGEDSNYDILNDTQFIADFNGDGVNDHALILFQKNSKLVGMFVVLSNTSEHHCLKPIKINKNPMFQSGEYYIRGLKPGKYMTPNGILNIEYWGIIREEIEFGWGTMFWFHNHKWMEI